MHVRAYNYLKKWKISEFRKPLVVRGARHVGKSTLVRSFGEDFFDEVVELNFEEDETAVSLFLKDDIPQTLTLLRSATGKNIIPGRSLLILDEIQAAPDLITHLRYFYEKLPELHVIATGSLLEFALKEAQFSMPVGRVEFLFLSPVTFEEYLRAMGQEQLAEFLNRYTIGSNIAEGIHRKLCKHYLDYTVIGGMPEAIDTFRTSGNPDEVGKVQSLILQTYMDDFSKYQGRVEPGRIRKVFGNSIATIGNKYVYARVDSNDSAQNLRRALELLCTAQLYTRVFHTSAQAPPLRAGIKETVFKVLFLDVGLVARQMRISLVDVHSKFKLHSDFLGAQAEQFIGQHLLASQELYEKPELYYWVREKKGSSAEIDYLQYLSGQVYPIEVKAGAPGTLRSLGVFLSQRRQNFAVRYSLQPPVLSEQETTLLSLPLYLVEQHSRLVAEVLESL